MIWRIILETFLVVILVFASANFWACAKAPSHLRRLLNDPDELNRLIEHIGLNKLLESALAIEPVFGSYEANINAWNTSHFRSLSQTRNLLGILVLAVLGGSWFLGDWYLAANAMIFALMALMDIPSSAKNNNLKHLPSIMLNLIKWLSEDPYLAWDFAKCVSNTALLGIFWRRWSSTTRRTPNTIKTT